MCNVYLHRGYMGICIKVEDHNQGQGSNASYTHASRSRVKDIGIISAFIHASCVHATCIMDICIMVGYIPHGYKHHDTCLMDTSIMDLCSVGEEVERRCWSTLSYNNVSQNPIHFCFPPIAAYIHVFFNYARLCTTIYKKKKKGQS